MLALSPDLQGAQALVVVPIVTGTAGLLVAFAGGKCTNFIPAKKAKAKATVAASVVLIISGFLCLYCCFLDFQYYRKGLLHPAANRR